MLDIDTGNYDYALHYACHNVSLNKLIKRLIDSGSDVNAKNRDGDTPLHILCMSDCEIYYIKVLIENGAYINALNSSGNSPLHIVTKMESHDKVKLFLELGADVNITGYYGKTPLHIAVKSGNLDIVNTLINSGSNVNCKDYNESALHFAFYSYNSTSIAKLLLEKGADINALNIYLYTPLYRACSVIENNEDKLNSIKLLIDEGANVNSSILNNNYRPLLCHVNNFPHIVKLLLDNFLDPNNNAILENSCFTNIISIKYVISHIALQYYISASVKEDDGFIRNLECIEKDSVKKEIWDECNNELDIIFNTKISRLYFISIFLTSTDFDLLSNLVENEIVKKLNVSNFKNYGQKLEMSIDAARNRNELLSKAMIILDIEINSGWNLLSYEVKRYILGIMKNEDLMNLVY